MRHIFTIDATAIRVLEDVLEKTSSEQTQLILSGVQDNVLTKLKRTQLYVELGEQQVVRHIDAALARAQELLVLSDVDAKTTH